jgi:membrane protease subunit HflK
MSSRTSNFFVNYLKNSPWGNPGGNAGGNSGGNSGNNNPWGARKPQDSGDKPGNTPGANQGKKVNKDIEDQIDEMMKKSQKFFKDLFGGGQGNNSNNNSGNDQSSRSIFGLIIGVIVLVWLGSGIYKIDSDENGLVLYFGKFYSVATPGLNYHLPAPFGQVIKESVTSVNTDEFGFSDDSNKSLFGKTNKGAAANNNSESLMLTGDENIVDIDFQIQWQVSDIKGFVFNISDPELTIRKAADSAMREIIARTPIADALSDGKLRIEQETKALMQEILDSYGAGVRVVLVQLRRVDPPAQVIDAFRDVQTAKADKEKEINQAQAYSNDVIPRAKGEASKITEDAKAYKQEVVANAEGQVSRFNAVYTQYAKSKVVTRKRMYLEQMERTYRDIDKIIVDKNISKTGAVPYLQLGGNKSDSSEKADNAKPKKGE